MNQKKLPIRIYLIGLPSSGKSTFGRQLAKNINYNFVDTDAWIVQKNQCAIPEIFEKYGEDKFREWEREALEATANFNQTVIATGGGMPCFFDNISKMNQLGISVFMDVKPQTITKRIRPKDNSRPLLKTQNEADILTQLQKKYEERIRFYQQAHITLNEQEITPETILRYIG